jgi:hypothetical protein
MMPAIPHIFPYPLDPACLRWQSKRFWGFSAIAATLQRFWMRIDRTPRQGGAISATIGSSMYEPAGNPALLGTKIAIEPTETRA